MVTMSATSRPQVHDRAAAARDSWLHAPRGAPVTQADLEATPWYGRHVEAIDGNVHVTPFTAAERDDLPDDGRRHELLDGTLIMSPAPTRRHQAIVVELLYLLRSACPEHLRVLVAPTDVELNESSTVEPDLFVSRREDLDAAHPSLPLLVVEVMSPSTRRIDRGHKKDAYERAGIPDYWIVDPDELTVTAWQLDASGVYREVARATGDETFTAIAPFDIAFTPAELIR